MKICITAKGATLESPVDERFGRAPYFIIIDSDTGAFEAFLNPYVDGSGGVGPKAAQVLISHDAKALISGAVGGNAREALSAAGIAMYTYREGGSVRDALDRFTAGALERTG